MLKPPKTNHFLPQVKKKKNGMLKTIEDVNLSEARRQQRELLEIYNQKHQKFINFNNSTEKHLIRIQKNLMQSQNANKLIEQSIDQVRAQLKLRKMLIEKEKLLAK